MFQVCLLSQIERDTNGMLQCHPYPHEYADTSRPCAHCAFFMGLQRKEGVRGQEGQQFDIRGTVDEFRQDINMYMFWKPGMDIYVSHVRRKELPAFVFPKGYKRPRLSRHVSPQGKKVSEDGTRHRSSSGEKKRKTDYEAGHVKAAKLGKRVCGSPQNTALVSPEGSPQNIAPVSPEGITCGPGDANCRSEVRSPDTHLMNGTQQSVSVHELESMCCSNSPSLANERNSVEVVDRLRSGVSCAVPSSEFTETHRNRDIVGQLESVGGVSPEVNNNYQDGAECRPCSAEGEEAATVNPINPEKRSCVSASRPDRVNRIECQGNSDANCDPKASSGGLSEIEITRNIDKAAGNSVQQSISVEEQESQSRKTHQNGDHVCQANMDCTGTKLNERRLNWIQGAVDVEGDIVKACCQAAIKENVDLAFTSSSSVKNLSCEVRFSL